MAETSSEDDPPQAEPNGSPHPAGPPSKPLTLERARSAWAMITHHSAAKWAVGYILFAYGTLGASLTLRDALGWSALVPRLTTYALLVGFVVLLPVYWLHGHLKRETIPRWEYVVVAVLLSLGGAALAKTWSQYTQRAASLIPDVALRFVDPTAPDLVIDNLSGAVVRDIIWAPALWDVDYAGTPPGEPIQPLQVPSGRYDWLRPHSDSAFENLFSRPAVASELKRGDRVYGSVSVSCPLCVRSRTYILALRWSERGWYYEVPSSDGEMVLPQAPTKKSLLAFVQWIDDNVPISARIPIRRPKLKPAHLGAQHGTH